MFETIKQIFILSTKSKKVWLIPVILFLVIIALLIVMAQASPLPVFIYPII